MKQNDKLYKTVHWRRLRKTVRLITKMEEINLSPFDLEHIKCYQTYGFELQGKNTVVENTRKRSCFVGNNQYDVFEIPTLDNVGQLYGTFLVLTHNTSYDYWVLCRMEIKENGTKIKPFGFYDVVIEGNEVAVTKKQSSGATDIGEEPRESRNEKFDALGNRKIVYGTSQSNELGRLTGMKNNTEDLKGGKDVPIYKKKK